jgi:hypothetical protein
VATFVPGQELARAFYEEVVAVALGDIRHSAALLGTGSDVLGFDTERSTDHGWGPRMHVFAERGDVERVRDAVDAALPDAFRGWPWLRALPLVGAIDQFVDSTDVTSKPHAFPHVASLFETWVEGAAASGS